MVYPHHGAGKVLKKEMKEVLGEKREYLTIKILHNDMTVMVPCENADRAGLRRVIGEEAVTKVLAVLRDDVSQMPKNWNRRFKHNREKIKTGDVYELAEVVRNLAIRETEKGLSTGEKQMYTRAKKILASELMYALEMEEDEAEAHLEDLIAEAHASRNGAAGHRVEAETTCPSSGSFPPAAAANALGRAAQGVRRSGGQAAARLEPGGARAVCERVVVAVPAGHAEPPDRVAGRRLALGVGAQRPGGRARGRRRRRARRRAAAGDARARAALPRGAEDGVDGAIAAAPVTDTVKEAGAGRAGGPHARPLARCGRSRRRRCSAPRCCGARSTWTRHALAAATDDASLVEAAGRQGAGGRGAAGEPEGHHARRPASWRRRCCGC